MVTFKEFLAEYASKENAKFFGITNLKAGNNGKSFDSLNRKHSNLYPKHHKHKHPVIDRICQGKANNVLMVGAPLLHLLGLYDVHFTPGVKILGNSAVEVEMIEDEEGTQRGILRSRKKQNGL